ncbi:NAD(P)H-flavin reductase [Candidatus Palibaumannia cicadellinicola]|uniref:Ferrisiderophore reductase n=1 Tax=Baumannia cicadellinicola subsp. Homalodisca coagulata TaxID=374463 RepID=Q1LU26_BAUCH|nr:NAD(P)H-flavin reductase [Candidatus Baumannia cicadellinicola]ABF14010.1 ferrisiderophore reductase [Baumannia cicadellinicola str. Hc (Homalodisca coagulata)]MBS0032598.1 NAD(P)H-flavin reductase [Candidatus Baumannia cicadellinicola]MCJ7462490.1 NAD(P)H-flavin reductase [Candidatus Baumannia cicadellinicola]MCJ7462941.1 NAD(P)H-flavin reductase [Candidatus Baumannia cicadellinicola]
MITLTCKVLSIDEITPNIYRILLIPEVTCNFRAGQYLMIIINEQKKIPFSIASTPRETNCIELHISASVSKRHLCAMTVINFLLKNSKIVVEMPQGTAWLRDDTKRPIMLIASGTGFAYARSILLTVLKQQPHRMVVIYSGGRTKNNLYYLSELENLLLQYSQLTAVPVIELPDENWTGRTGSVLSAVMQDYNNLEMYDIYMAGSIKMVKSACELFCTKRHAHIDHIFSDALTFLRDQS